MLIAQISDTHITAPGTLAYGVAPTADKLKRCVDHINQLVPQPDLVLHTGDVSKEGLPEAYEHAASLLDNLNMPYYLIPGNHDDRLGLWATFGGQACPSREGGFIDYVIEDYDLRMIALDSTVPGEPGGEICQDRAAWLDKALSSDPEKPTLIFMHHPPLKFGVIETDIDGFEGADRLAEVVERYTNIERILCGHIHLPAHTCWKGTTVSTAPATGMQSVLDLQLEREEFTLVDPAFLLHHWTEDNNLITFYCSVDPGDGPFPFVDQD